jgi:hypothetical protein
VATERSSETRYRKIKELFDRFFAVFLLTARHDPQGVIAQGSLKPQRLVGLDLGGKPRPADPERSNRDFGCRGRACACAARTVADPNSVYDVEVNLDERSRGLKWFFSFYISFSADTQGGAARSPHGKQLIESIRRVDVAPRRASS